MRSALSVILLCGVLLQAKEVMEPKISEMAILVKAKQGVPHEINYQGWLGSATDTTGITDTLGMIFRLYTAPTGGIPIWNESHIAIPVIKGIFNVYLGEVTPLPASIFTGTTLWLETQVMNDTLSPRKKLVSVGYAIKAEYSDTATYALTADVQYVDSARVATNAWRWNNTTWGVDYPKADKADTANYVAGANVVGEVAQANHADTADYATGAAPHNHMGEDWSTTTGTYGLRKKIDVNSVSAVYCAVDSALNAGTGATYGGRFHAGGGGTGIKYGTYGYASAPSASSNPAYGSYGAASHSGTGDAYGSYAFATHYGTGTAYGGQFYGGGLSTGIVYGVWARGVASPTSSNPAYGSYGWATHSGTGTAYGGRFYAEGTGTGTKYGVYGLADAPSGSSASIYGSCVSAVHSGTGNAYGGRFSAEGTGTGYRYGTYSSASAPSTSSGFACGIYAWSAHEGPGEAFGGRFSASGAGTGPKYGVYAFTGGSGTRYAGYFSGDVNVTGTLTKGAGSFLIDHPLDPTNKTLRHNFVESPENLCLYRGKVKLDSEGRGLIKLPNYFTALTKEDEASVNLTPVGKPFITGCEWNSTYTEVTVYGEPNREVFYIVLTDRDDPVIKQLGKPVEEEKGAGKICERGELLYPEAYGYSKELGRDYKLQREAEDIRREPKPDLHKPDVEPIK